VSGVSVKPREGINLQNMSQSCFKSNTGRQSAALLYTIITV
jgi:hypothetical protein